MDLNTMIVGIYFFVPNSNWLDVPDIYQHHQ